MKAKVRTKYLNSPPLFLFIAIFASIGIYFVINSFAATTSCTAATTSTFTSVFNAAQPGSTICLASGTYTFGGGNKALPGVTITSQSGAAASFKNFVLTQPNSYNGTFTASGITFDGVNIDGAEICAPAHDLTFKNLSFTQQVVVRQSGGAGSCGDSGNLINSNITFDNDHFDNINAIANTPEGRVHLYGDNIGTGTNQLIGLTIKNSTFSGGTTDGIQNGANGVQIINNKFVNIIDCGCGPHTDSIQLYGSSNTLVKNNYFYNDSDGVVSFDPAQTNDKIINNIIHVNGPNALVLASDQGTEVAHNTVINYAILYGSKTGQQGSANLKIQNNISAGVGLNGGTNTNLTSDHNMWPGAVSPNIPGSPQYVGTIGAASSSTSYPLASYALKSTSPGYHAASDGTDVGADVSQVGPAATGATTTKPGDTNNDNVVNIIDLSTLLSKWNTNYTAADFNKDNTVNIFDLSILLSNYGK